jgi:hypothetical protein
VYQNVSPVLTPLLSQFSGDQRRRISQLAADARPTAICAWGKDNRIEAASNSHLFGFDFLALSRHAKLPGNKTASASVKSDMGIIELDGSRCGSAIAPYSMGSPECCADGHRPARPQTAPENPR